jgi:transposase
MSLRKQPLGPVPENTARVAKAAFRKGNSYIKIADELGTIYDFSDFVKLFSSKGQLAKHPVRLVLVTVLQFAEGLSDRQAADAVRARIDWKYLLHLDLDDPGFDFSILSEFRGRLLEHSSGKMLLDKVLEALREQGLVKSRGKQRTDSMHVLAAIRVLNRLELVHETMRVALDSLATVAPDWLTQVIPAEWYQRYARQVFSFHLPKTQKGRLELAFSIGADGFQLLEAISSASEITWLNEIPAVVKLRKVWEQQFTPPPGPLRFLEADEQPRCAERISSPHDEDARFSQKRGIEWTGYKVHITETCDEGLPRIITNVQTTFATLPDSGMLPIIHRSLARKKLLPADHLADTGYVNTESLVSSRRSYKIRVIGPPLEDSSWQAQTGGFDKSYFQIDWRKKYAKCPAGKTSKRWTVQSTGETKVSFNPYDCYRCKFREVCVRGLTPAGHPKARHLNLQPRTEHEALLAAREWVKKDDFKQLYNQRAGIEGTLSQAVRKCGLRTTRYTGLKKTTLEHLLIAVAMNLTKTAEWLLGTPLAKTRESRLARLRPAQAA